MLLLLRQIGRQLRIRLNLEPSLIPQLQRLIRPQIDRRNIILQRESIARLASSLPQVRNITSVSLRSSIARNDRHAGLRHLIPTIGGTVGAPAFVSATSAICICAVEAEAIVDAEGVGATAGGDGGGGVAGSVVSLDCAVGVVACAGYESC